MSSPACFVATIDLSLREKLKSDLESQGFTLNTAPYAFFQAKKGSINLVLYTSGKLTVQGKDKHEFITYYLEPEILQNLSYSYPHKDTSYEPRIGVDEAGKGDFYGPLCIAGCYADKAGIEQLIRMGVRDSKTMPDSLILKLSQQIKTQCDHSIIRLYPKKYNELYDRFRNLNRLLAWGHATVIATLVENTGCRTVTIDQFAHKEVVESSVKQKNLTIDLTQRHKGEEDLVVAAASILARAAFVEGIDDLGKKIGQELPKGAGKMIITTGKKLLKDHGQTIFNEIAKLHFKTYQEILNDSF